MNTTARIAAIVLMFFLTNNLWAEVPFTLTCPPDVYVDCTDELWDLSIYGNATYTNYQGTFSAGNPTEEFFLNSCNIGVIKRTWTVEDPNWNQYTCTQIIHAEPLATSIAITWPDQIVTVEGCDPNISPDITGSPTYIGNQCSMVGVNHEDITFTFGPQCEKTIRKWTIIDWCTYDPDLGSGAGYYTFQQTIKVADNSVPTYNTQDTIRVASYNCLDAYVDIAIPQVENSPCGGSYEISHNSSYADSEANASGLYPIGEYTISYVVNYGCSLKQFIYQTVVIENAVTPVPYCIASVVTALCPKDMDGDGIPEDGEVEIWAKDFDLGSYYPCNPNAELQFSFSPDLEEMSALFTCAEVGSNMLNMYVTDNCGKQSYCTVELIVQNNAANIPNCEAEELTEAENHEHRIEGYITSSTGQMMSEAKVRVESIELDTFLLLTQDTVLHQVVVDSTEQTDGTYAYIFSETEEIINSVDTVISSKAQEIESDIAGEFGFEHLPLNLSYHLRSSIETFETGSVTVKDAEILMNHLLGIKLIEDPLARLAADIDEDNDIDYDDFFATMKVVRDGVYPEAIDQYWYLIDQEAYLSTGEVSKSILVNFDQTILNNNFLAVQKGDLTAFAELHDNAELEMNTGSSQATRFRTAAQTRYSIFPNPAKDFLVIEREVEKPSEIEVTLYNTSGAEVLKKAIDHEGLSMLALPIDIPSGIYSLMLKDLTTQTLSNEKLIIE